MGGHRSQTDYRLLFDASPLPMWVSDRSTLAFLDVNDAAAELFGYSREEFLAMTVRDIRPPEEIPALLRTMEPDWDPEAEKRIWRYLRKDGSVIEADVVWRDFDYQGRPGRVAIVQDLTERRRAEEELRESDRRWRLLAEGAEDFVVFRYRFTPEPVTEYISAGATALTGRPAEEHYADPELVFKIVHPDDRHLLEADRADPEAVARPLVLRWVRRDGSVVWTQRRVVPLLDERGNVCGIEGIAYDVTERVLAEQALRESEQRYRSLVETDPNAIIVADTGSTVTFANVRAAELYGSEDPSELTGLSAFDLIAPEEHERLAASIAHLLEVGVHRNVEYTIVTRDGRRIDGDLSTSVLTDAVGEPTGFMAVAQDISRRKASEREIEATMRELRQVSEQRQQLLARLVTAQEEERRLIAGDIHDDAIQKLVVVGMRLQMLAEDRPDISGEAQYRELTESVAQAISSLRHLMFELRPYALDRDGLVPALKLFLQQQASLDGFEPVLESRLEHEPSPEVRLILYRIAQEAVVNARKHARASRISIGLEEKDGGFHVRVSDDGIGVPDGTGSGSRPGHLGLTTMRERAELAGGWWRLSSEPGRGTQVEFWVPDADATRERTQ